MIYCIISYHISTYIMIIMYSISISRLDLRRHEARAHLDDAVSREHLLVCFCCTSIVSMMYVVLLINMMLVVRVLV